jgi:hypothetical protein
LFDADTSWYLIWSIVETAYAAEDVFEDPTIASISDRMSALCRAHGTEPPGLDGPRSSSVVAKVAADVPPR